MKWANLKFRFKLLCTLAAVVVCLLLVGAGRTHKAHEADAEEFGIVIFSRISEWQLTEDATFSGVVHDRVKDRLLSTYDRSKPRGKKACPT